MTLETALAFHREVFTAGNLLGAFAGHTHRGSVGVVSGVPQRVTESRAAGVLLHLEIARRVIDRLVPGAGAKFPPPDKQQAAEAARRPVKVATPRGIEPRLLP